MSESQGSDSPIAQTFFKIPDDVEAMAELVKMVPSDWSWVTGWLFAPQNLIDSGDVVVDTGFLLERFAPSPIIVPRVDEVAGTRRHITPNFYSIVVERKLPGFVAFENAGTGTNIPDLLMPKSMAVELLRKGYRGHLTFFVGAHGGFRYENAARCELVFTPWKSQSREDTDRGKYVQSLVSHVRIISDSRYTFGDKLVAPLVARCRQLGLEECEKSEIRVAPSAGTENQTAP